MRTGLIVVVVAACGSKSAQQGAAGSQGSASAVVADASVASGAIDAPPAAKRPPAPKLDITDKRPIERAKFDRLNPRDATRGTTYASADGGCHVYVRDPKAPIGPPGSFPPPTDVPCPPEMLAPEWGYCVGPGTISATADRSECICQPGAGDPPGPAFRIPCPK